MAGQHVDILESSMQKTQLWLKGIEKELHGASRAQAYAALRGVLHALRDCLPPGEVAKFAAQMPVVIRGVFYDGWKPRPKPERMTRQDFYNHVDQSLRGQQGIDCALATQAVVRALYTHLSAGELARLSLVLPREVRALWSEVAHELAPALGSAVARRGGRIARGVTALPPRGRAALVAARRTAVAGAPTQAASPAAGSGSL